jgi:hypothetical protein
MVEGRIFLKMWSKALRSGGSDAMRIPIESSELDQMVRLIPSQVGSCVLVIVLSSMVLKTEHIVALQEVSGSSFS